MLMMVFSYADDACICYVGDDWESTFTLASNDLQTIYNWYTSMTLQLNLDKSNYMTFSITSTGQPPEQLTLTIPLSDNQTTTLQKLTSTRYLGIILDQHLKWSPHIQTLQTKLRHLMHIFSNLRRVCSKNILRMVYHALVQSLLQYCICSWGGAYTNAINPLKQNTKNYIQHKDRQFHTKTLRSALLDVFPLTDIYMYKMTLYSIKYDHLWPRQITTYNTRRSRQDLVQIRRVNKSLAQRHFYYLGLKLYNIIPQNIKMWKERPLLLKLKTQEFIKQSDLTIEKLLPMT
uniref:Reverse transcriptase domain-containing protein n=1 Tax=Cacopsylla melanoneura TaxID=428564 RepID=A0A8D8UPB3_9HEMI